MAVLGLCCCGQAVAVRGGATLCCRAWAIGHACFSSWDSQTHELWHTGLVTLCHVESSWTRDWNHVPCTYPLIQGSPNQSFQFCEYFWRIIKPKDSLRNPSICNWYQKWGWSCALFTLTLQTPKQQTERQKLGGEKKKKNYVGRRKF